MFRRPLFARFVLITVVFLLLAGSTGQQAIAQTTPPGGDPPPPADPAQDGSVIGEAIPSAAEAAATALDAAAGVNYQSFSGIEFNTYNSEASHTYSFGYATAHMLSPSTSVELLVPLDLPQGAEVREITLWFRDNQAGQDIYFGLCRVPNGGTASGCMTYTVNTAASGNTGTVVSRTLTGSPILTIDNFNNTYFLVGALYAANQQFGIVSARVGYSSAAYLPAIRR